MDHPPEISLALRNELQLQRRCFRLLLLTTTLATISSLTVATLVMLLFGGISTD